MSQPFTDNYDWNFILETMMGPNAMRVTEELADSLPLRPGMRVLDLGCGKGISSILLAEKYDLTVFAADLWIAPGENARRFEGLGLDSRIFPLLVDATRELPFAGQYFDLILSVDAYQYFGGNQTMLPKLLPLLKPGGLIAVAVPGFNQDFPAGWLPEEVRPFWTPEWYFYSVRWWRELWEQEPGLELLAVREMDTCQQAWDEWLQSPDQHAGGDLPMIEAGAGKYFNFIQLVGRKR